MAKYRLGTAARQIKNELRVSWRYHVDRVRTTTPVFQIAQGRTGSNLLLDYIGKHPSIKTDEEILNPWSVQGIPRRGMPSWVVKAHIQHSINIGPQVSIVKLGIDHLRWQKVTVERLAEWFPTAKYVVQYRQDLLKQYISFQILVKTGVHKSTQDKPKRFDGSIHVDRGKLLAWCRGQTQRYLEICEARPIRTNGVAISYEELTKTPASVCAGVFQFLGLPPVNVTTNMERQGTRPLEEVVENFSEIADLVGAPETTLRLNHVEGPKTC